MMNKKSQEGWSMQEGVMIIFVIAVIVVAAVIGYGLIKAAFFGGDDDEITVPEVNCNDVEQCSDYCGDDGCNEGEEINCKENVCDLHTGSTQYLGCKSTNIEGKKICYDYEVVIIDK